MTISVSKLSFEASTPNNPLPALISTGALLLLLALELADRVTMKRDLEIAREIQHWLVPQSPPEVPGVEIAFMSRPANTVGGDYYDAFMRASPNPSPNSKRLLLADVAGKSVPAALLMATFQASLRSQAQAPVSLIPLVKSLNQYACAHSLGRRPFTTEFLGELDSESRVLGYVRAGHNAPFIRRASGRFERLETGDLPLGINPDTDFTCGTATMAPGDLLVMFTDGLIEAVNEADQEFGESHLLELLKSRNAANAQVTLKILISAVDAFADHTRQHDDITFVLLRTC